MKLFKHFWIKESPFTLKENHWSPLDTHEKNSSSRNIKGHILNNWAPVWGHINRYDEN